MERCHVKAKLFLVVIQAGGQPETLPCGYTPERWQEQRRAWDAIQQDLLKLSTTSHLMVAEKSTHAVQIEQPDVVINAIRQVLRGNNAHSQKPLNCATIVGRR